MDLTKNRHARWLFDGAADKYDTVAQVFSFFQYGRWRRYLIARLNVGPEARVMDPCTGTAGVALHVVRTYQSHVVALDLSPHMLDRARQKVASAGLQENIGFLMGRAENLAFADGCFDAACVTYLLRYVDDPKATLGEILRVIKPGGRLVALDFQVPDNPAVRGLWYLYTRAVLPLATRLVSPGWREVGGFLGPNISRFCRSYPVGALEKMWSDLGIEDIHVKRLSLGGAVVMWGTKSGG